jgi:hypothetical protein
VVKQLHPRARDAAQRRINRITVGVIAASIAGTLGLSGAIAIAAPPPKHNNKTDYGAKSKKKPATKPTRAGQAQSPVNDTTKNDTTKNDTTGNGTTRNDKPESSSGDEQTTSGGS